MADAKPKRTNSPRIASHVPGRIRLKLPVHRRDQATMESIKRNLQALDGIHEVRLNPACGSVTVHYDHARHTMAGILGFLEDLDVVVESIGHLPSIGANGDPGHDRDSPEFIAAIDDLNRRIRQTTGLPFNLKLLLPLAFVGAGTWSIAKKGWMIEGTPGWLFLWFAFDMFVKLHPGKDRPV